MDLRAVQVICMAVSTIVEEIPWAEYGKQNLHTPVIQNEEDCRNLDLLMDMMGSLTRILDTRINYVTAEGKVIREWIEHILELGSRYRRELENLEKMERRVSFLRPVEDPGKPASVETDTNRSGT